MENLTDLLISCFNDTSNPDSLPVGFSWTKILSKEYGEKYNLTILLHGNCIKYGLNSETYASKYGTCNPFVAFLSKQYVDYFVKIIICSVCLQENGFDVDDLLDFVRPIPFSVDYIARSQLSGSVVVYDAKLDEGTISRIISKK